MSSRPAPARLAAVRELLDKATQGTEHLARPRRPAAVGSARVPTLPVAEPLREALPAGGLAKGSTMAAGASVSLLFGLLAEASRRGHWCALVGMPDVGLVAAHEAGLDLACLALVPDAGDQLAAVASALIEGIDIVVLGPCRPLSAGDRQRLTAKTRQSGAVLIAHATPWPGADLDLDLQRGSLRWEGLSGEGRGRLRARHAAVRVSGRGVAARARTTPVLLPGPDGSLAPAEHLAPPAVLPEGAPRAPGRPRLPGSAKRPRTIAPVCSHLDHGPDQRTNRRQDRVLGDPRRTRRTQELDRLGDQGRSVHRHKRAESW